MKLEVSTYERLRASEMERNNLRGDAQRERRKVLGHVLDVFGLRDAYPDVEKVEKTLQHCYSHQRGNYTEWAERLYTEYGVDKFASDLEKAAAASVGDSSLKTIRKAIK